MAAIAARFFSRDDVCHVGLRFEALAEPHANRGRRRDRIERAEKISRLFPHGNVPTHKHGGAPVATPAVSLRRCRQRLRGPVDAGGLRGVYNAKTVAHFAENFEMTPYEFIVLKIVDSPPEGKPFAVETVKWSDSIYRKDPTRSYRRAFLSGRKADDAHREKVTRAGFCLLEKDERDSRGIFDLLTWPCFSQSSVARHPVRVVQRPNRPCSRKFRQASKASLPFMRNVWV